MTEITDFIRERAAEDRLARRVSQEWYQAVLEIVQLHDEIWPVFATEPPALQKIETVTDFNTVSYQLRQNIEWHTRDSYVKRFGAEPPTNPIVRTYARIWSTHSGYKPEWA